MVSISSQNHFTLLTLTLICININHGLSEDFTSRGPKFLSFLTKIKDSFLPSFTQKLPEPQLFVDLRKINNRNDIQNKETSGNQNSDDHNQWKILLPTRVPPIYEAYSKVSNDNEEMKMYMSSLREKIKTMYKEDQNDKEKEKKRHVKKHNFGAKVKLNQNLDRKENLPEDLLKKIIKNDKNKEHILANKRTEVANRENIFKKRRVDVMDVLKKENNIFHKALKHQNKRMDLDNIPSEESRLNKRIIELDDVTKSAAKFETRRIDLDDKKYVYTHATPSDLERIPQESNEKILIVKPLNKILAKSDDIIFKQMNFWRDQFESRRLIDFLTPNKLLQEPNTENELLDIKKSRPFQKSVDYDLANSNQWHRKSAENIITEELRTIQNTLMADDWTPLNEVPKILGDTPNIYQLNSNEMNDILMPTENKNVNKRKRIYPNKYIGTTPETIKMTAAPDTTENITSVRVEVENSLIKPDIRQTKLDNFDRFFMKNKNSHGDKENSAIKTYDFNVMSELIGYNPQERSISISNEDTGVKAKSHFENRKVLRNPQDEKDKSDNEDVKDDIVPLYLHIPKSKECPNFCISINVEISRTGRQIQSKCRKSLICKVTKKKRNA